MNDDKWTNDKWTNKRWMNNKWTMNKRRTTDKWTNDEWMMNERQTNNERTMNDPAWFMCLSLQVSPNQLASYTVGRIRSHRAALTRRNELRKVQGPRSCSARHAMSTFASRAGNCTTSKGTLHHTLQQFWAKSSGWDSYTWLLGRF